MATLYTLKPKFQSLVRPFANRLVKWGFTANQVTIAALMLSAATGGIVYMAHGAHALLLVVPVALLLRMMLNAIDGLMAREHGMRSVLGGYLNELGDVFSDAVLYLPLATYKGFSPPNVALFVIFALGSEVAGILPAVHGGARRYDGPLGKSDRALAIGLVCLLLGLGVPAGKWVNPVFLALNALVVWTIVNRVRRGMAGAPA